MNSLKEKYEKEIKKSLMEKFNYDHDNGFDLDATLTGLLSLRKIVSKDHIPNNLDLIA